MSVLYTEMKVKNISKYLLMKTTAYNSCVFNETPAQDLVASIFNRRTFISCEDKDNLGVTSAPICYTSESCHQLNDMKENVSTIQYSTKGSKQIATDSTKHVTYQI